ncbi:MAG: hypothetical protein Q9224_004527 [Gallowayella concinna]
MFAKSTLLAALFAVSAQLVAANEIPPACMLAGVNTQPEPWNLNALCGKDSSKVQNEIRKACNTETTTNAALKAYKARCADADKTVSVSTSAGSSSSTSKSHSGSTSTSDSSSDATTSADASTSTNAPYPIVYTSTYFDNDCSCTKTASLR